MLSRHTFTPRFSRYSRSRMAVVVLPLPEGPVSATMRRSRPADRMAAAAEDTLSWNTSSHRRTNCVSLSMA